MFETFESKGCLLLLLENSPYLEKHHSLPWFCRGGYIPKDGNIWGLLDTYCKCLKLLNLCLALLHRFGN